MVFLSIVSLNLVFIASNQSISSIADVQEINITYPRLFVTKTTEKSEIVIGKSFVVTVTIKNFGNKTAYNVTFIDQLNQPWIFEISGLTLISYGQIGVNQTRQLSYLVTTKSLGIYHLFSAQIEYYDSNLNPTKFATISNEVEITVIEPPEDFSLANFNVVVTFFIVLIILDTFLVTRLITPKLNKRPK